MCKLRLFIIGFLAACALQAGTWYVRPDGGDRSQCNGQVDAPYPGGGSNRPCAFKHPFYLFTKDPPLSGAADNPSWVISGGDTVVIKNGEYRIGYKTNEQHGYWNFTGCRGDAFSCYNPPVPAGTPEQPTRIVGEQWSSGCASMPKLVGGIGVGAVLNLGGAKWVEVNCLDLSDYAQCGATALGSDFCVRGGFPKSDYALRGILVNLETDNVTLRNLNVHGLASSGIQGRVGGTINADNVRIAGIAGGGWDTDDATHTYSNGALNWQNVTVEWAGCVEEYPLRSANPYYKCFDQSHRGYGDGVGILADGMTINIDKSIFRYSVQDGVDILYITDEKDTDITITRSAAYGNGGQQWKLGPARTINFNNNLTVANCRRFAEPVDGAPETYNQNVTDYCRALDGVAVMVKKDAEIAWVYNTAVGYTSTVFDVMCQYVTETFDGNGRSGLTALNPSFRTNGQRKSFDLSFPPVAVDSAKVLVNGQRQTIGVLGRDSGRQWYWSETSQSLVQDESVPALAASDALSIRYIGLGVCDGARFTYANNIFRGYDRLDTKRTPGMFWLVGFHPGSLLDAAGRRNNLFCGARELETHDSEVFSSNCPGNWFVSEPNLISERDLDALDVHLGRASQAIDTAMPMDTITTDHDGIERPQGRAPDIGAFEFNLKPAGADRSCREGTNPRAPGCGSIPRR